MFWLRNGKKNIQVRTFIWRLVKVTLVVIYFSGLVVVTDGCIGVHDAAMFESILTQLRTSTISCTFLRVGDSLLPSSHFGHIAHTELMHFIATATFGAYFDSCPDVVSEILYFIN